MSRSSLTWGDLAREFLGERNTEAEASQLVHEVQESNEVEWVPLGREPNNYSIVENQQADAMAAFTELVVNSIDAVILRNFYEEYGDDYRGDEYESLKEAADALINEDEDRIEVTARGQKDGPYSLTLFDNGCGQPRDMFEHTFLNVLTPGELKQDFEFLQGKYGMGSTGVLPFCGDKGYKFIASSAHDEPGFWSWSIIRKNREKTRYEYLTVNGGTPSFEGEIDGEDSGTFVKLFEYQSEVKSEITKRFRYRLERYITESPIGIQLIDERYEGYGSPYSRGLRPHIESKREHLEDVDRIEHSFDNEILGEKTIEIFLFKDADVLEEEGLSEYSKTNFVRGRKHDKQAILFSYNGQTHGDQGMTFLRRRCDLRRVAKDTLVIIDFSDVSDADVVDLFKPSRDRLQNKAPAKVLKEELEDVISENEMLLREERRRRNRMVEDESEDLEENILEEILQNNPSLKGYLQAGEKQPTIEEDGEEDIEFEGEFYPTKFNVISSYRSRSEYSTWDEEETYTKRIPANKTSRQRFELDAENGFFSRGMEPGELSANLPTLIKSKRLKNGILSLTIDPTDVAEEGDSLTLSLTVSPANTGSGELSERFKLDIIESVEEESSDSGEESPPAKGFDLPDHHWVREENWEAHGFDEYSIVSVDPGPQGDMDIWINRDAAPLVNFIRRHNLKEAGKKYIEEKYKLGIVLYSMGQYIELEKEYDDDPAWEEIDPADVVNTAMKGVAQSLLEQTISDEELSTLTY